MSATALDSAEDYPAMELDVVPMLEVILRHRDHRLRSFRRLSNVVCRPAIATVLVVIFSLATGSTGEQPRNKISRTLAARNSIAYAVVLLGLIPLVWRFPFDPWVTRQPSKACNSDFVTGIG